MGYVVIHINVVVVNGYDTVIEYDWSVEFPINSGDEFPTQAFSKEVYYNTDIWLNISNHY